MANDGLGNTGVVAVHVIFIIVWVVGFLRLAGRHVWRRKWH
jgi:hypothetical protein